MGTIAIIILSVVAYHKYVKYKTTQLSNQGNAKLTFLVNNGLSFEAAISKLSFEELSAMQVMNQIKSL